jgi:murein DD-endopeptidase MepM/ murein hydrolase activator NlpD
VLVFLAVAYAVGKLNPRGDDDQDRSRQSAVSTPTPAPEPCTAPLRAGRIGPKGMWDSWRGYGSNRYRHHALDIYAPVGTPIYAIKGGTVINADTNPDPKKWWDADGWGRIVYLQHEGGTSLYAHTNSVAVRTGDRVAEGQQIATVGHSGNAPSNDPHLHLEIGLQGDRRFHRNVTDPVPYLKGCGGWNSRWG